MAERVSAPHADDLLQPTVGEAPPAFAEKPWRVSSQLWVAFFGGVLAVTVVAWLNARRLGIPARTRVMMVAIGGAAGAALLPLWMRIPPSDGVVEFLRGGRSHGLYSRLVAVGVYLILARMQKRADAHFQVFGGGDYASLWKTGLLAVVVLGALQTALLAAVAWGVR